MREPIYEGVLNLARLGEAVKESKEAGDLFRDHNKKMDAIAWRIDQTIHVLSDLYTDISGETTSTLKARMAKEAPRKPYNQRSMLGLYLEWVQIRKSLISDLNEFCNEAESYDAWEAVESLDLTISKDYAHS
jgi:hypothetical protein